MNYKTKSAIVTSVLSGLLVFFGAFVSTEDITLRGVIAAIAAASIVAITKFRDYFVSMSTEEEKEMFTFL